MPERRAHQLLAAADFVLMPSRSEPCGLVQMFAQRYGAIPIVTATGGLVDTVVDVDADLETGTGIVLPECSADDVAGAVGRAVSAFRHPRFPALRSRVMRLDVGWERPARRYAQVYSRLIEAGS
jgi:starch synthase